MRKVTLYIQDHDRMDDGQAYTSQWMLPRYEAVSYFTKSLFYNCPQEAFEKTNHPHGRVGELAEYVGPSMSVGDVCKVMDLQDNHTEYFLCTFAGWEKKSLSDKEIFDILKLIN